MTRAEAEESVGGEITVLVSSRDEGPADEAWVAERVANAARLAEAAREHGWTVRLTFARADIADRYYLKGTLAKPAHVLESVAVRLARGSVRGYAIWYCEGAKWKFAHAYLNGARHGHRSIVDVVADAVRS